MAPPSELDSIFNEFQRNINRVDAHLKEIIDYTDGTIGTGSTAWDSHRDRSLMLERCSSVHTDFSSITVESIYLNGEPLFKPGSDWNAETEQERIVCVRGSFAKDIAMTLNTTCPVGFIGDEEAAMVDVDFLLEALRILTIEREKFIQESLEIVESARNAASIAAYIECIEL